MIIDGEKFDQRLTSAIDRLAETEWYANQLLAHYHNANPFRWALNGYLRCLKEISQIIQMGCQTQDGFTDWYKPHRDSLCNDPIVSLLAKQRDIVVHQKMLLPDSKATVGVADGRKVRLGLTFPLNPLEDSDTGILQYCATGNDILGVLMEDEDNMPCVERIWRLSALPDNDIVELAFTCWQNHADLVAAANAWLSGNPCTIVPEKLKAADVPIRRYSRQRLRQFVDSLGESEA